MKKLKMSSRLLFILVATVVMAGADLMATQAITASRAKHAAQVVLPSGNFVPARRNAPSAQGGERTEMELVKLTAKGFEPAEITRPAGKFLLGVTNRTGLPELSLRLIHESRRSVDGKRLGREISWRRVLDLPPGRYALREASHPDWVCRITINAR